jgi:hypothetical protein
MVARLSLLVQNFLIHPFEHLVEFREMINVLFHFDLRVVDDGLNIDLDDVTRLVGRIDLALTTIANVVDHSSSARRVALTTRSATTRDLE